MLWDMSRHATVRTHSCTQSQRKSRQHLRVNRAQHRLFNAFGLNSFIFILSRSNAGSLTNWVGVAPCRQRSAFATKAPGTVEDTIKRRHITRFSMHQPRHPRLRVNTDERCCFMQPCLTAKFQRPGLSNRFQIAVCMELISPWQAQAPGWHVFVVAVNVVVTNPDCITERILRGRL